MGAFIEFQKVNKEYRNKDVSIDALNDVNFILEQGEICVVYGKAASGKSVLLGLLAGIDTVTSGKFFVDGDRVSRFDKRELSEYRAKEVGYVPQALDLLPNLTAIENVELGAKVSDDPADAYDVLERLGLEERVNSYPSQLSGAEKHKVALARALAKCPKLLIWDEPACLDPDTFKEVLIIVLELCQSEGMTVVIGTQNKAIAAIANKVLHLNAGDVVSYEENNNANGLENLDW